VGRGLSLKVDKCIHAGALAGSYQCISGIGLAAQEAMFTIMHAVCAHVNRDGCRFQTPYYLLTGSGAFDAGRRRNAPYNADIANQWPRME